MQADVLIATLDGVAVSTRALPVMSAAAAGAVTLLTTIAASPRSAGGRGTAPEAMRTMAATIAEGDRRATTTAAVAASQRDRQ